MTQDRGPRRTQAERLFDQATRQHERGEDDLARESMRRALDALTAGEEPLRARIEEELRSLDFAARVVADATALKAAAKEPRGAVELLEAALEKDPNDPGAAAARAMIARLRAKKG